MGREEFERRFVERFMAGLRPEPEDYAEWRRHAAYLAATFWEESGGEEVSEECADSELSYAAQDGEG